MAHCRLSVATCPTVQHTNLSRYPRHRGISNRSKGRRRLSRLNPYTVSDTTSTLLNYICSFRVDAEEGSGYRPVPAGTEGTCMLRPFQYHGVVR